MKMIYLLYAGIIVFVLNIILNRSLHLMTQKAMIAIYFIGAALIFIGIVGSVLV